MVLGDGQDVVVADHREVGIAEDPLDLGRAEHPAKRLLDPLLGLADLAPEHREPAAGGVEHLAPGCRGSPRSRSPRRRTRRRPARSPPSRGNWSPTRASQRSRLPSACRVSTVSASSSGSSIAPIWARRTCGRMSCRPPKRRRQSPEPIASAISVVSARRSWISAGSSTGSSARRRLLAQRAGRARGHAARGSCRTPAGRACACPCRLAIRAGRGDRPRAAAARAAVADRSSRPSGGHSSASSRFAIIPDRRSRPDPGRHAWHVPTADVTGRARGGAGQRAGASSARGAGRWYGEPWRLRLRQSRRMAGRRLDHRLELAPPGGGSVPWSLPVS